MLAHFDRLETCGKVLIVCTFSTLQMCCARWTRADVLEARASGTSGAAARVQLLIHLRHTLSTSSILRLALPSFPPYSCRVHYSEA